MWRLRRRDQGRSDGGGGSASPAEAFDAHVDEGLMITKTALRLAAKNRVIMRAMRDGEPVDLQWFADALRADIQALIDERESDAQRLEGARASARRRLGRPQHFHDYRHADARILALRQKVDLELAERLRPLLDDDRFTLETLAAARESALDEIVAAHSGRQAELTAFVRDDLYVAEREDRLASVRMDLEALRRARSW